MAESQSEELVEFSKKKFGLCCLKLKKPIVEGLPGWILIEMQFKMLIIHFAAQKW